jgi:hypothetical protein
MRQFRSSGSVEGVVGNHGSYSDSNRISTCVINETSGEVAPGIMRLTEHLYGWC